MKNSTLTLILQLEAELQKTNKLDELEPIHYKIVELLANSISRMSYLNERKKGLVVVQNPEPNSTPD
ncbi:MAG: hypothetical protein ACXVAX_11770 [Pseudobdellovibrio sp.]